MTVYQDNLVLAVVRILTKKPTRAQFVAFAGALQFKDLPGSVHQPLVSTLENMITSGQVTIVDDRLQMNVNAIADYYAYELGQGHPFAWQLAEMCEDFVRGSGYKFDDAARKALGRDGEEYVLGWLRGHLDELLGARVKWVSEMDDSLGYDIIAPDLRDRGNEIALEVKTSSIPGNEFQFFISRNEYNMARQLENWFLIGVQKTLSRFQIIGHLDSTFFVDIPEPTLAKGVSWESLRVQVPVQHFSSLLPGYSI